MQKIKEISASSSAYDRFSLVASTCVGFDSIVKVEPVAGRIKVRQVYDPSSKFWYQDLVFVTQNLVQTYSKSFTDDAEWNPLSSSIRGLRLSLDHCEWIGGGFGVPGVVGTVLDDRLGGWIGIKWQDLVRDFVDLDVEIPRKITASTSCEAKLGFLGLVAFFGKIQYRELLEHSVDLNYDRNTGCGNTICIMPGKTEEYLRTHDYNLLSKPRYTWGIRGKIIGAIQDDFHQRLIIRGSNDGDNEVDMVVDDFNVISGLTKLKKPNND